MSDTSHTGNEKRTRPLWSRFLTGPITRAFQILVLQHTDRLYNAYFDRVARLLDSAEGSSCRYDRYQRTLYLNHEIMPVRGESYEHGHTSGKLVSGLIAAPFFAFLAIFSALYEPIFTTLPLAYQPWYAFVVSVYSLGFFASAFMAAVEVSIRPVDVEQGGRQ